MGLLLQEPLTFQNGPHRHGSSAFAMIRHPLLLRAVWAVGFRLLQADDGILKFICKNLVAFFARLASQVRI